MIELIHSFIIRWWNSNTETEARREERESPWFHDSMCISIMGKAENFWPDMPHRPHAINIKYGNMFQIKFDKWEKYWQQIEDIKFLKL